MKKTEEPAEAFDPRRPRHFKPGLADRSRTETPEDRNLALSRSRLRVAAFAFIAAFSAISLRLADVTLLKTPDPEIAKLGQTTEVTPPHFSRADIVDRNGVVLATTLQIASLFANPKLIDEPAKVAHQLAGILPNSNEQELYARLSSGKSFVWLQRRLTPQQEAAINALGVPGLDFQHEEQRIYPQGALASHVVGYTDLDGKGLAGIERSFNNALGSSHDPLKLTIDIRLQAIVREELQKQIQDFNGIGGTGIVMNVKTGEILSMISLPDFDPNDMNTVVPENIFNRATLGVYEMGSVFKIFNTSLALNNGTAWLSKFYDVSPIHIGRFTIHDDEPQSHPINVARIFQISSNIGSAHMAMEVGPDKQKAFLGSLGLLRPPSIEIPEIGMPQAPRIWHDINTMTIAFGQGIAVSPIQLAVAANAIADGGIFRPATLIKPPEGFDPPGQRVLPENIAQTMRKLLRLVVTDGTGRKANVPGYWVGGKTGSAQKVLAHGGYAKKSLISSFISFFPINDPQYMVYVLVDDPHGNKASYGFATGGWVGAPLAGRIIARMAPLFGLKPIPETPELDRQIVIDPNAPGGAPPGSKKIAAN